MERMEKSIESICDRSLPTRVKKVYGSVVRPVIVYGLETVAVTKQVEEMEVAEMKIFYFAFILMFVICRKATEAIIRRVSNLE